MNRQKSESESIFFLALIIIKKDLVIWNPSHPERETNTYIYVNEIGKTIKTGDCPLKGVGDCSLLYIYRIMMI